MKRTILATTIAAALILGSVGTSTAANPIPGMVPSSTLPELTARARSGDPEAQRLLGDIFDRGKGVRRNSHIAAGWYRKAAAQGDRTAQRNLGYLYETGHLGEKDYVKAEKWYRKAALRGDSEAQLSLAYLYESGLAGHVDETEAAKWRDIAEGRLTEPTDEIAIARRRVLVSTLPQGEDERETRNTLSDLAAPIFEGAGQSGPVDIGLAFNLHLPAAEEGDAHAQYRLGLAFLKGTGVRRNFSTAKTWLQRASERGYSRAQATLGAMHANGIGTSKNIVLAYFWLKLALHQLPEGRTRDYAKSYIATAARLMSRSQQAKAKQLSRKWATRIVPASEK